MAKKKTESTPLNDVHVMPESEVAHAEPHHEEPQMKERPRSQRAAIEAALEVLGRHAKVPEIKSHLLTQFGMDLRNNQISQIRSTIRRKAGETSGGRGEGRGRQPAAAAVSMTSYTIEDIRTVKDLLTRMGARRFRDLVELLSN